MAKTPNATLGITENYNENSQYQLSIINSMKKFIHSGIDHLDLTYSSSPIIIADYGSSHGRNSIEAMKIILSYLEQTKKSNRSIMIIHNDLPTNDWRKLFQLIEQDKSYFGFANGQSFYEQCLPSNTLSIGFSSTSIHWLSKTPCNITNHCFHTYANDKEHQMFRDQAKKDYNLFIENRSKELLIGGILIFNCFVLNQQGQTCLSEYLDIFYECAKILFTRQELENILIPMYIRSLSELLDDELFNRCSLKLIQIESIQIKLPLIEQYENGQATDEQFIKITANHSRSGFGSMIQQVLETNKRSNEDIEQIINQFWIIYEKKLKDRFEVLMNNKQSEYVYLIFKKIQ